MRRQEIADGQLSVWASNEVRPDPFDLPVEYKAEIFGHGHGDQDWETIIVSPEEVSFSDGDNGVRIPMKQFLGVAMAVAVSDGDLGSDPKAAVIIVLEHEDPALNVPLFVAWDSNDIVATWHAWARALDVPLTVRGMDGVSTEINDQTSNLIAFPGISRRAQASNGAKRRLTRTLRRSSAPLGQVAHPNRVEIHELIARQ